MRALTIVLASAVLGAGAAGAAIELRPGAGSFTGQPGRDHDRPGPDSARVAMLLDALGRTDPLLCDLLGDQIGNFWNSGERDGIGRLAAAPPSLRAAKDSIGGTITDQRAINRLVAELDAANTCTRRIASKLLGRSVVSTSRLEALLHDASANVRESAAMAAGNGEHHDMVPALIRALGDPDIRVRRAAAEAIGELDDLKVAPPGLVAALSSNDAELRHRAAKALCEIADPSTTSALVGLLSSADTELRKDAVEGLGKIGTPEAVRGIARLLDDKDPKVRLAAVEALGNAKDRE